MSPEIRKYDSPNTYIANIERYCEAVEISPEEGLYDDDSRVRVQYDPTAPHLACEEILEVLRGKPIDLYYDRDLKTLVRPDRTDEGVKFDRINKSALRIALGRVFQFYQVDASGKNSDGRKIAVPNPVAEYILSQPQSALSSNFPDVTVIKEKTRSPYLVQGFIAYAEEIGRKNGEPFDRPFGEEVTMTQLHGWMSRHFAAQNKRYKDWPANPAELAKRIKRLRPTLAEAGLTVQDPTRKETGNFWYWEYDPQFNPRAAGTTGTTTGQVPPDKNPDFQTTYATTATMGPDVERDPNDDNLFEEIKKPE